MILLLDLGNSRLKYCLADADHRVISDTLHSLVFDVRGGALLEAIEEYTGPAAQIERIVMASVAPQARTRKLSQVCQTHWGVDVQALYTLERCHGLLNGYRDHTQMGVDRWLALLGARTLLPGRSLCVVDAGSALTVDVLRVGEDGRPDRHCGGLIASGARDVGDLFDEIRPSAPSTPFGRSTAECLAVGQELLLAASPLGFLKGRLAELGLHGKGAVEMVLTGGGVSTLMQAWGLQGALAGDLVFRGMLAAMDEQ